MSVDVLVMTPLRRNVMLETICWAVVFMGLGAICVLAVGWAIIRMSEDEI
jgi:hypothetical protein